jgi:DNA-binding transcriptional MerR regulator
MSAAAPSKANPKAPLPPIPAKRYFTIGEVSDLCGVKPHVLRYWEQEFTQLRPMKRRGNRRYYQHHEVLLVRRIRELLYEQGFTISGARNRLGEALQGGRRKDDVARNAAAAAKPETGTAAAAPIAGAPLAALDQIRAELSAAIDLLTGTGDPAEPD